ncbi:hypothetical protein IX51_04775 [uncultured archaeon]|nr:hypothetical protein IX51_04775 [uncultured archaeon]
MKFGKYSVSEVQKFKGQLVKVYYFDVNKGLVTHAGEVLNRSFKYLPVESRTWRKRIPLEQIVEVQEI